MPVGYKIIDYDRLEREIKSRLGHIRVNAVRRSFRPNEADSDLGCIYPIDDDEIIYTQTLGAVQYVARYNLKRAEFIWKNYELSIPFGIDYNHVDDKVMVSHNSGIDILDARNGEVLKRIRSVDTYTLPRILDAVFNPANPDEIYFAVPTKHVVVKLNYVTGEYKMYGTWDTAKTDTTGFNVPSTVEIDPSNNDLLVAEVANNRIMRLDADLTAVKDLMLLPRPAYIRRLRWGLTTQKYGMTVIGSESGGPAPMYTFGYQRGRRLKFILPMQLDAPRFSPDLRKMWGTEVYGYEFDLDALNETYLYHGETAYLLNNSSVSTSGYSSYPLVPLIHGKNVLIILISNQSGTLKVQIPDRVSLSFPMGLLPMSVPTTFNWIDYDVVSTGAGVTKYSFAGAAPPVFRIVYIPDATANVTMHVTFYP
jgi:hypothetical protein